MRWRLRTLMIAVGLVALALGTVIGLVAERRRSYYRMRVESLAWGEADVVERIALKLEEARLADASGPEGASEAVAARAEAEWLAKLASWHVKLERSYMRAAERPWEAIPPDPAPPTPPPGLADRTRSQLTAPRQ